MPPIPSRMNKKNIITYCVPILIVIVGIGAGYYFSRSPKGVDRKPPATSATPVIAIPVVLTDARAIVHGMGLVIPAVEIQLKSRVAGDITSLPETFIPGGHIQKGQLVAQIDSDDYQVALKKAESGVEKATADMQLEQGNQTIAREEVRLLSRTNEQLIQATDLLLRKPQLAQAQADLHSAEADLQMAELNLERTNIYSPFNAMVTERHVNLGTHVNSQDTIAILVGTDAYWVQASVPLDQLSAIQSNETEQIYAKIISQTGVFEGHLKQITGTLTDNTRMARVIIQIDDPLQLNSMQAGSGLLLDDYVEIEITGKELKSVIKLPRQAVRDNGTVWLFDQNKLVIQSINPVWKTKDFVYLKNDISPDPSQLSM